MRHMQIDRAKEQVERLVLEMPLNEAHQELISEYLEGPFLDHHNAEEAREFVRKFMEILDGRTQPDDARDKQIMEALRSARLPWEQAFIEAVLNRIADDPAAVISHIEARDNHRSQTNSANARKPRLQRHDWWSKHIGDCLDDNINASVDVVIKYLLDTGEVKQSDKLFTHLAGAADPITRVQVRSRMEAAKKRLSAEI